MKCCLVIRLILKIRKNTLRYFMGDIDPYRDKICLRSWMGSCWPSITLKTIMTQFIWFEFVNAMGQSTIWLLLKMPNTSKSMTSYYYSKHGRQQMCSVCCSSGARLQASTICYWTLVNTYLVLGFDPVHLVCICDSPWVREHMTTLDLLFNY